MNREELEQENARLRRKLSPLEDPVFTEELRAKLSGIDLNQFQRSFRGGPHIILKPNEVWVMAFNTTPSNRDITVMGRSLQAMGWERSALHGQRIFVMKQEEYNEQEN
jgi:hypothetical protein